MNKTMFFPTLTVPTGSGHVRLRDSGLQAKRTKADAPVLFHRINAERDYLTVVPHMQTTNIFCFERFCMVSAPSDAGMTLSQLA